MNQGIESGPTPPEEAKDHSRPLLRDARGFTRALILVVVYSLVIVAAHWVAYLIRFDFHPPLLQRDHFWLTLQWALPVELVSLLAFGQFRSLLSYFSLPDARRIAYACALACFTVTVIWHTTKGAYAPARSIIVLSFFFDTIGLVSVRIGFRMLRERQGGANTGVAPRRIMIIGAGDVGANLAKEMMLRRDLHMRPVAFFDDDSNKWNTHIHGVPVLGRPELMLEGCLRADEAIIAMPSANGKRIREVVQVFNEAHIKFEIVPSMEQIVNGSVKVSQIRPVEIEDLLGRERVNLETGKIRELVRDKVVMVTGAGGSIGSELCRQIAGLRPARLLLVERCEVLIFQIEQELLAASPESEIVPLVADVLDPARMRGIFECFRPHLVLHAAAHKHVPMMECQPFEAFRNNTLGTKLLAELSAEFCAERFVLISTDKAINPTNAMGATKRLAELYIQALQSREAGQTQFMAVRFGNVLGSSGSVIPTFRKQIANGGPVTVTHPEVTRYFMSIPEAVGLVLQSATQGRGGEIFVLNMGKPIRIVDLAKQLIELSGLRPGLDIEIEFTGLRPGEKLFEEINLETESLVPTDHPMIMRFIGKPLPLETLDVGLRRIHQEGSGKDPDHVKLEFQRIVPEYRPQLNVREESVTSQGRS
jgi:FlaA1/EpsC-like NDP-sugar epimerase